MVSYLRHSLAILVTLVAVHYGFTLRHHQEWKKLILTHHWPATVCE
ncbi:hypothetical protein XELAEV_180269143mg, partial [Xenopus laevis]